MEENNQYGVPIQGTENVNTGMGVSGDYTVSNNLRYTVNPDSDGITVNESASVTSDIMQPVMNNEVNNQVVNNQVTNNQVTNNAGVAEQPEQAQEVERIEIPQEEAQFPRIVVKTDLLKSALAKSIIVAGNSELQPVTEVAEFKFNGNNLQIRSSDKDNILTVYVPVIEATDGAAMTLKIAEIKPLVDKLKCATATFIIKDLKVTLYAGAGKYEYNQAIDLTENKAIVIPEVESFGPVPLESTVEMTNADFMKAIESVFPLVAGKESGSIYGSVFISDKVTSTTGSEIAVVFTDIRSKLGSSVFLKSTTVKELIALGVPEKFRVGLGNINGNQTICIYADDYRLYAVSKEGVEDYPSDDIDALLSTPVGTSISISKTQLLDTIDRLCTFLRTTVRKSLDVEKIGNRKVSIRTSSGGAETLTINGDGSVKFNFDAERLKIVAKAIETDDLLIEPISDGDGPASYIRISSTDKKQSFIVSTVLE